MSSSINPNDATRPTIQFHHYQYAAKCTIHGVLPLDEKTCGACCEQTEDKKKREKVHKGRHLTLLLRQIGVFT
jgi:hypothetical protein